MAWYEFIDKKLSQLFYHYGKLIARHPRAFLVSSMLLAAILSLGVVFLTVETDTTYLFTPEESRARDELHYMEEYYPPDYDNFWMTRSLTTEEKLGDLIVTAINGDNVLTDDIIDEVFQIDADLRALQVHINETYAVNFTETCGELYGECLGNPLLNALAVKKQLGSRFTLTYPTTILPDGTPAFIGTGLGGVNVSGNGTIISAKALNVGYLLRSGSTSENIPSILWEDAFSQYVLSYESDNIRISHLTSQSLSDELNSMAERVMPLFIVTYAILFTFAVMSCLTSDWVQSKPWLGQAGVISATLAIASSVGVLGACGVAFTEVVASMPFLVVGIGIDDMFIMLAAWRKTNRLLPVEERMGHAYSEAAVSITITSITDGLAFCIGAMTPLPAVRVFCLYTGVAIMFDYVYQITFFGACMVYTGHREANNKHCYTCKKVVPKDEAPSRMYRMWCAGGLSRPQESEENHEQFMTYFFKKHYGPFLVKPIVKLLVVLGFCGIALYGCMHLEQGLEPEDIFSDDSYAQEYIKDRKYFSDFGFSLTVVFKEDLDYWDANVQAQCEKIAREVEEHPNVHEAVYTDFWLREFKEFLLQNLNTTEVDQKTFISVLRNQFLTIPFIDRYKLDIIFSSDDEIATISSSRLLFKLTGIESSSDARLDLMQDVRKIADNSAISMQVFAPFFVFVEQYVTVLPTTLQCLIIATVCMFFVTLVLIPHPVCAFMVTICIVTIETGVIGFMTLWDVKLDVISMMNIILCIGFSVDFAAHITYAFITAPGETGNQRTIEALHTLGTPIFQAGFSTILAISIFFTSTVYIIVVFFKTMLLVMVFGLMHGLVFLPVFLSYLNLCLPRSNVAVEDTELRLATERIPTGELKGAEAEGLNNKKELVFINVNNQLVLLDSIDAKETVL